MPSNKPVKGQVIHKADLDNYLYKNTEDNGVVEGGQYYDFHKVGSTADFDARLGINDADNSLIITSYNGIRTEANTKFKGNFTTDEGSNIKLGPIQPSTGDGGNIYLKAGITNSDNVQDGENGAIVRTSEGKNSNFRVITVPVLDNNSGSAKYYNAISVINNINENKDGLYSTDVYIGSAFILGVINPPAIGQTTTPMVMYKDGKVLYEGNWTSGTITLSETLYNFKYLIFDCSMAWHNDPTKYSQTFTVFTDRILNGSSIMFNNSDSEHNSIIVFSGNSTTLTMTVNEQTTSTVKRIVGFRRLFD